MQGSTVTLSRVGYNPAISEIAEIMWRWDVRAPQTIEQFTNYKQLNDDCERSDAITTFTTTVSRKRVCEQKAQLLQKLNGDGVWESSTSWRDKWVWIWLISGFKHGQILVGHLALKSYLLIDGPIHWQNTGVRIISKTVHCGHFERKLSCLQIWLKDQIFHQFKLT